MKKAVLGDKDYFFLSMTGVASGWFVLTDLNLLTLPYFLMKLLVADLPQV